MTVKHRSATGFRCHLISGDGVKNHNLSMSFVLGLLDGGAWTQLLLTAAISSSSCTSSVFKACFVTVCWW